ncbi:MAG TPA: DUF1206 domain-containing protein [Gaiellaceae bacterium]|nr:DUF1206 domain-containing protein [Gaiellaceae bacterium]
MSTTADAKRAAHEAASSPWTKRLARAGLVAKGLTFGLVAVLALDVAISGSGKLEDRPGALRDVAESSYGRVLLAALAVGLAGYAIWRLVLAVLGRKLETGERESAPKRVADVARAVLYGWLAFLCAELVFDADEGQGQGNDETELTARILDWPLGRWLVGAAGLAVVGAGVFNLYRALSQKFRKDLKEEQMKGEERRWYTVIGVVGHAARGIVFLLVGFFIVRAAWEYDPQEAIGLDGALAKLAHAEYGSLLLGAVAAGLLAYALFCFVQARYRSV